MGERARDRRCPLWCVVHTDGDAPRERLLWHASRFTPVVLDMYGRGPVTGLACVHSRGDDPLVWVLVSDAGRTVIDMPVQGWRSLVEALTALVARVEPDELAGADGPGEGEDRVGRGGPVGEDRVGRGRDPAR